MNRLSLSLCCLCSATVLSATALAASSPTTQPVTATAATSPASTTQPPAPQTKPVDQRFAYAVGYMFGRHIHEQLQEQGRTADNGEIFKGVIDGLEGHPSAYPPEQIQQAIDQMRADSLERDAERRYATDPGFRRTADDNARHSEKLLKQSASMAEVETLPDGVQVRKLKPGNGRMIGNARSLLARYTVSLADGTKVFSCPGDKPATLEIADLLPALVDSIRNMKSGGTWMITLPADKAYGLAGKPPLIGPNEALQIEFTLVKVH